MERSARLTSLQALLRGEDVDSTTVEPLNRQYERAKLLERSTSASSRDLDLTDSRRLFEVVVGRNDNLPRQFLEGGSRVGDAVCRVIGVDRDFNPSFGTAISIAPGIILTNNHVLPTAEIARLSKVEFGFWTAIDGNHYSPLRVGLDPNQLFFTDVALDFSIVCLDQFVANDVFNKFGAIDLVPISGKALIGEAVNIIHHGGGGAQSIAVRNNLVVDVFDDWIHYTTDTLPGASGAPVMNDQWQLVALHHASIEQSTEDGRKLVVNEGIRISSICAMIKKQIE